MPKAPRFRQLLDKAETALITSIEIYNKPDFPYREETFAILALNAWELLLKARVLMDNKNNPRSLYVYEKRPIKSGPRSQRKYIKRSRTGNPYSKALTHLLKELESEPATRLPSAARVNLMALTEIRDNAVHFMNASPQLSKQVLEIGTASVKNFLEISRRWFGLDLSAYKLYLMPIGFVEAPGTATAVRASGDEGNLIAYLQTLTGAGDADAAKGFHVALDVNISLKRGGAGPIVGEYRITTDPAAPEVQVKEEDYLAAFPWDYAELTERLQARYVDFKQNARFHQIRKPLLEFSSYVRTRYLNPSNPRGGKKDFYNPNIVGEFDKHYTRR